MIEEMKRRLKAISLFSSAGIGDIGFKASGMDFILMNELLRDRSELLAVNYPNAKIVTEDILTAYPQIIRDAKSLLSCNNEESLFLISCTAPCQGMSKSGQGTLLKNIREGKRPQLDPRNRLILPALKIIQKLCPEFVVFENVQEMRNTLIEDENGVPRKILDLISEYLGKEYSGEAYDIEMADYGVPQRRKRLITVYTKNTIAKEYFNCGISLVPAPTHSSNVSQGQAPWVSVAEALKDFPKLDAKAERTAACANIPFHRVSVISPEKYEWIRHAPENSSAFDNQCINPKCRYDKNQTHSASKNHLGINQTSKTTPLYCEKCGSLLPRPYVKLPDGKLRIMSGYTSAYKRMSPRLPAPTLTRNMSFPCSDQKVHYSQNRVLSLAEAFRLHTLDRYNYQWGPVKKTDFFPGAQASDTTIRESIGESIPPVFLELLGKHLQALTTRNRFKAEGKQLELLSAV